MQAPSCCTPFGAPSPSGVAWFHSKTCAARPGKQIIDEPIRHGIEYEYVIDPSRAVPAAPHYTREHPARECSWHQDEGTEYTTSGICLGPACASYSLSHWDDGWSKPGLEAVR